MQTGNATVALRIGSGSALKVEADVQHDSDGGGRRGGQTDHSQARIGLDAHEAMGRRTSKVCTRPCTMTQTVLLLPLK